jgi:hypothetical protein
VIPARQATGELKLICNCGAKISGRTERLPCGPADAAPEQGQPHAFGVADHDLVPDLERPQRRQTPTGNQRIPGNDDHIALQSAKETEMCGGSGGRRGAVRSGTCSCRARRRRRRGG